MEELRHECAQQQRVVDIPTEAAAWLLYIPYAFFLGGEGGEGGAGGAEVVVAALLRLKPEMQGHDEATTTTITCAIRSTSM